MHQTVNLSYTGSNPVLRANFSVKTRSESVEAGRKVGAPSNCMDSTIQSTRMV